MLEKQTDVASRNTQHAWVEISQSISAEQIRDFYLNNFAKLDRDGNGRITKTELETSAKKEHLSPGERQILNRIELNYDSLANMTTSSQSEFGFGQCLIPADLIMFERYHKQVKQELKELNNLSWLAKNFASLDKNADGFFSRTEMNTSGLLSTPLMQHVAINFNQIRSASNDEFGPERAGISRHDIKSYRSNWLEGKDYFNDTDFHPTISGQIAGTAVRPSRTDLLKIAD